MVLYIFLYTSVFIRVLLFFLASFLFLHLAPHFALFHLIGFIVFLFQFSMGTYIVREGNDNIVK